MKKRRKLINHIRHCKWILEQIKMFREYGGKHKSYYFRKQIEVAEKLLKTLK